MLKFNMDKRYQLCFNAAARRLRTQPPAFLQSRAPNRQAFFLVEHGRAFMKALLRLYVMISPRCARFLDRRALSAATVDFQYRAGFAHYSWLGSLCGGLPGGPRRQTP